jgi:hypothetical protein
MQRQINIGLFGTLVLFLAVTACGLAFGVLAGYTVELNAQGMAMHNPEREAQATRIALVAQDEASARALQVETERRSQPAAVLGKTLTYRHRHRHTDHLRRLRFCHSGLAQQARHQCLC